MHLLPGVLEIVFAGSGGIYCFTAPFPQFLQKLLRRLGKDLEFFPGDAHIGADGGRQRAEAQDGILLGQGDAAVPPDEQGLSQLLLQIHQLAGQGRLGEVQAFRRAADALLTGYREEVAQNAQFHKGDLLFAGGSSVL